MHEFRQFGVSRSADTGQTFADKEFTRRLAGRTQSRPRTAIPHDEAETRAVAGVVCRVETPAEGVTFQNLGLIERNTLARPSRWVGRPGMPLSSLDCGNRARFAAASSRPIVLLPPNRIIGVLRGLYQNGRLPIWYT
jgi:hypothetical protein